MANRYRGDSEEEDEVLVYSTVNRSNPQPPTLLKVIKVGDRPTLLLPSRDCSTLVVGHENGRRGTVRGSITFIRNITSTEPTLHNVLLDDKEGWDDEYLLNRGLNMPLTKNALEYWDDHSHLADELNFTEVREDYQPAIFLKPEMMAWGNPEETELLVNLQIVKRKFRLSNKEKTN